MGGTGFSICKRKARGRACYQTRSGYVPEFNPSTAESPRNFPASLAGWKLLKKTGPCLSRIQRLDAEIFVIAVALSGIIPSIVLAHGARRTARPLPERNWLSS